MHSFLKRPSSEELPSTSCLKKQSVGTESKKASEPVVVVNELDQSSSRPKHDSSLEEVKIDIGEIKEAQGKILEKHICESLSLC